MNAPVDKRAAAGHRFCGKVAAESGNGAVCAERCVYMVHFSQLALGYHILNTVYGIGVAVAYADGENASRFIGHLFHFERFGEYSRCGFFAEDIFSVPHKVN